MTKKMLVVLALLFSLVAAACSDDDGGDVTASGSASGSASGATSEDCEVVDGTSAPRDAEVHVKLNEWAITLDNNSVKAGNVEFDVKNIGGEVHEFVIVQGAKPDDLTITDKGVEEEALPNGATVLGEVEGMKAGAECPATFELTAGDYTLLCNIVDDKGHVHVKDGMITAFSVT